MGKLITNLSEKQELFYKSLHTWTILLCGRMFGKSTVGSVMISNRLTHHQNVLVVAPTYSMLRNSMIRMVRRELEKHGYRRNKHYRYNGSTSDLTITWPNGHITYCYFRSAENKEAIRSVDGCHCLFIDEAALVDQECVDIAMACIRGPDVTHPQYYAATTPRGAANWVSVMSRNKEEKMDVLAIRATSYDNPNVARASIDNLMHKYGDMFARQEIYAEILDSTEDGLFKVSHMDVLKDTSVDSTYGEVVAGFDVAGSGGDFSSIAIKQGNTIIALEKRRTPDDSSLVEFFDHMYRQYRPSKVNIDTSGLGHFLPGRLESVYPACTMVGCNFSSREHEGYANLRTKIYFDLREDICEGKLHFSSEIGKELVEEVEVELLATEYELNSRREFALVSKDDIKKEINRSPDASDSLALACYKSGGVSREQAGEAMQRLKYSRKQFPSSSRRFK